MTVREHEVPGRTRLIRVPIEEPDPNQLTLDAETAEAEVEASIDAAWHRFHTDNPHVFAAIVEFAKDWAQTGKTRCSMNMIFETLRADYGMRTYGDLDFKLNNNLRSRYTRLLQETHPQLGLMFETRALQTR